MTIMFILIPVVWAVAWFLTPTAQVVWDWAKTRRKGR